MERMKNRYRHEVAQFARCVVVANGVSGMPPAYIVEKSIGKI